VSIPAALAQQTAEALAGVALIQLLRPGCPVVLGSFLSNIDMQSGSPMFGTRSRRSGCTQADSWPGGTACPGGAGAVG